MFHILRLVLGLRNCCPSDLGLPTEDLISKEVLDIGSQDSHVEFVIYSSSVDGVFYEAVPGLPLDSVVLTL